MIRFYRILYRMSTLKDDFHNEIQRDENKHRRYLYIVWKIMHEEFNNTFHDDCLVVTL